MKFESIPFKIRFFDFRSVWRAGIVSWAIIGFNLNLHPLAHMKFESIPFKIRFFWFQICVKSRYRFLGPLLVSRKHIRLWGTCSGRSIRPEPSLAEDHCNLLRAFRNNCGTESALDFPGVRIWVSWGHLLCWKRGCDHKWKLQLFSVGFSSPAQRSLEKSAEGFEFGPRDIGFLQNIGANDKDKRAGHW